MQYKVLVTCIFLNKTTNGQARPRLQSFLAQYPSAASLQDATSADILPYFKHLGLYRRADWILELADMLHRDPPQHGVLRRKVNGYDNPVSEVAHLRGIGHYGSDAWRIFCKEQFYAEAGITVTDEWRRVTPSDKVLKRYIRRRRRERTQQNLDLNLDEFSEQMENLRLFDTRDDWVVIGEGPLKLAIPPRIMAQAQSMTSRN